MRYRSNDEPDLWAGLFREAKRSAFHFECRDAYFVADEDERLRAFLAGEPAPYTATPWQALMRETTERGVSVSRVRVVTTPLSDYQRWLLSVTGHNVEAGEDIRYVPRDEAGEIPPDDAWLFDDERVVYNLTDERGAPAGLAVTADPAVVDHFVATRDRLWKVAVRHGEFAG